MKGRQLLLCNSIALIERAIRREQHRKEPNAKIKQISDTKKAIVININNCRERFFLYFGCINIIFAFCKLK